jgi:WD40 repeat protein
MDTRAVCAAWRSVPTDALPRAGGFDGTVTLWAAEDAVPMLTLQGHTAGVRGVALSADGRWVVSSGPDAAIRVWDTRDGVLLTTFEGHTGAARAVAISADGGTIASSGLDATVRLWDARGGCRRGCWKVTPPRRWVLR